MNRYRAGNMNGWAYIIRRIYSPKKPDNVRAKIIRLDLPAKLEAIRPQCINNQADRHSSKHNKGQAEKGIPFPQHKVKKESGNPQVPEKIRQDEPFIKRNPVINHRMNHILRFRHQHLQGEKADQIENQIQINQTVRVCFNPSNHLVFTSHQ